MYVSYVSLIAGDIEALCRFYEQLLERRRIPTETPVYRAIDMGGGLLLAFSAPAVCEILGIEDGRGAPGTRSFVTFETDSDEELDEVLARATALGATVVKPPYVTYYDAYQAALADPEGNVFRINHAH